jgi:hypothetical protein
MKFDASVEREVTSLQSRSISVDIMKKNGEGSVVMIRMQYFVLFQRYQNAVLFL